MVHYSCDRCGQRTTGEKVSIVVTVGDVAPGALALIDRLEEVTVRGIWDAQHSAFRRDDSAELCSQCRGAFHEWMKPPRHG